MFDSVQFIKSANISLIRVIRVPNLKAVKTKKHQAVRPNAF